MAVEFQVGRRNSAPDINRFQCPSNLLCVCVCVCKQGVFMWMEEGLGEKRMEVLVESRSREMRLLESTGIINHDS